MIYQKCKKCESEWNAIKSVLQCPFCGNVFETQTSNFKNVEDAFQYIFNLHGLEIIKQKSIFISLLADYAPTLEKERRVNAFDGFEKDVILTTEIKPSYNPKRKRYDTKNETWDKVFILSNEELDQYQLRPYQIKGVATSFAKKQGIFVHLMGMRIIGFARRVLVMKLKCLLEKVVEEMSAVTMLIPQVAEFDQQFG